MRVSRVTAENVAPPSGAGPERARADLAEAEDARRRARSCAPARARRTPRIVAARAGRRRGGRAQGPRPLARAELRGAGEGRQGRRPPCRSLTRPRPGVLASTPRSASPIRRSTLASRSCRRSRARRASRSAPIRRSHHCGAAGHPVERLAEAGLVALLFANTPAAIAPWGGRTARVRHQPDRLRLPAARARRRSSSTSRCRRSRAATSSPRSSRASRSPRAGRSTPTGRPTTDPEAALAGTMLPLGDAKGTALALMVELLAAGLTGRELRGRRLVLPRRGRAARPGPASSSSPSIRPLSGVRARSPASAPWPHDRGAGRRAPSGTSPARLAREGAAEGLADRGRAVERDRGALSGWGGGGVGTGVSRRFRRPTSAAPAHRPA